MASSSRRNHSFRLNKKKDINLEDDNCDLNQSSNLNFLNRPSSSNTKWFNEPWRKINKIIEEKKEKSNQNRKELKEINYQELCNFSNDETLNSFDYKDIEFIKKNNLNLDKKVYDSFDDSEIYESEEIKEGNLSFDCIEYLFKPKNEFNNQEITRNEMKKNENFKNNIDKVFFSKLNNDEYELSTDFRLDSKLDNKLDSKLESTTNLKSDLKPEFKLDLKNDSKSAPKVDFKNIKHFSTSNLLDKNFKFCSNKLSEKLKDENNIELTNMNNKQQSKIQTDCYYSLNSNNSNFNHNNNNDVLNENCIIKNNSNFNIDEPIPSLAFFMSKIIDWTLLNITFIHIISSFLLFFMVILVFQLFSLSSFVNGFLMGIFFTFILFLIIVFYILNFIFQKIDNQNDLHSKILSGHRWKKFPSIKTSFDGVNPLHEGWLFELVTNKNLDVDISNISEKCDYDKFPDIKARLVYIKLEGTILRLFIPKLDLFKNRKIDLDKFSFCKVSNKMKQQIFDFSIMTTKRIELFLPRKIMNKKKYLWSKKYPFVLIIENTNKSSENKKNPFSLYLFARTNRDKEEWYNKFRIAIESAEKNLHIHHISTIFTPNEVSYTNETEYLPHTKPLDIGTISSNFDIEHLSNFFTYDIFIKDLLNQKNNFNPTQSNINTNLFWFNALVGRVFFDFLTHPHWTNWVKLKIQRKLKRIKLPYFVQALNLKDINLGLNAPKFLSVANDPLIDEKGIWIDFDLDYQGDFSMTLETKFNLMSIKDNKAPERELKPMKSPTFNEINNSTSFDFDSSDTESIIDLSDEDNEENLSIENDSRQAKLVKLVDRLASSKYFQQATNNNYVKKKMEEVSNMPICLTVTLHELKGKLSLNLPPPPTDRIWYGFRDSPKLNLIAKPAFGERVLNVNHLTQLLAKKLKQEFYKLLVIPNMDDLPIQVMMGNDIIINDVVP